MTPPSWLGPPQLRGEHGGGERESRAAMGRREGGEEEAEGRRRRGQEEAEEGRSRVGARPGTCCAARCLPLCSRFLQVSYCGREGGPATGLAPRPGSSSLPLPEVPVGAPAFLELGGSCWGTDEEVVASSLGGRGLRLGGGRRRKGKALVAFCLGQSGLQPGCPILPFQAVGQKIGVLCVRREMRGRGRVRSKDTSLL